MSEEGDDAADPERKERLERAKKIEAREAKEFWTRVFEDPVGRREMWKILVEAHTFEQRFACGPNGFPQPEATWFHAGEQALGQRLFQSWEIMCFLGVYVMLQENDPRFAQTERVPPDMMQGL